MLSINFIFVPFIFFVPVLAEMFSSIEHLKHLHKNEATIIEEYKLLDVKLREFLTDLEKKIELIESEHKIFSQDTEAYTTNPLNSIFLVKRLSLEVGLTENRLKKIVQDFTANLQNNALPTSDFEGACEGFLRLQKTYKLSSQDLADGIIDHVKMHSEMTSDDLYHFGMQIKVSDERIGQEYLSLALDRLDDNEVSKKKEILKELLKSYEKTKNYAAAFSTIEKMLEKQPNDEALEHQKIDLELAAMFEKSPKQNSSDEDLSGFHYTIAKDQAILSQACMGNRRQNSSELSKLYCYFQATTWFTKIAPFKVEVANLDPRVLIFHEILSQEEIEDIKSSSAQVLSRAMVVSTDSTPAVSNGRIAKLSWHPDNTHKVLDRLSIRSRDMSGLNTETAEMWQVQNYGIGGHYVPHFDFFTDLSKITNGNRIATLLCYLSDVEKGGATVFPFLRLYVPPRKGSAVLWYNLNSSGNIDYLTLHAACPVLVGTKWVANKWFHEHGQELTRPCGLQEKPTLEDYKTKFYVL